MATNTDVIRKLYADFQQSRIEAILPVCTEDTTWIIPGAPALAYAGTHRGRAAVGEFFQALGRNLAITEFTPEHYVADGEWVWVSGRYAGGAPAGSGHFKSAWVHRWRLAGGQVCEFHDSFDTLAVARAIGAV